ncbi:MAG: hypothetical protein IPO92_24180 [Saprospiraceae bacterium]|nr:hypothetical protein [Saprospiraceae bacterium]
MVMSCLFMVACKNSFEQKTASSLPLPLIKKDSALFVSEVVDSNGIDTALYDLKLSELAGNKPDNKWPVKAPYPLKGALLPFNRIVAYYGNFYQRKMGILGLNPSEDMLKKLMMEVDYWQKSDTTVHVLPALHYLAVTAQSKPGKGGMYRLRMPDSQIDKVLKLAKLIDAITILDIQPGHSTVASEIPLLENFLVKNNVHLGLDPEWSMKTGKKPGTSIGSLDAGDINFAVEYLADLVRKHHLPPKILVVHRFTKGMITNFDKIKTCPEVQIVINMDGFGFPAKKINSYKNVITSEPVQFAGFKLFYKNDKLTKPKRLMTATEILNLHPKPIYIQYQ